MQAKRQPVRKRFTRKTLIKKQLRRNLTPLPQRLAQHEVKNHLLEKNLAEDKADFNTSIIFLHISLIHQDNTHHYLEMCLLYDRNGEKYPRQYVVLLSITVIGISV